MHIRLAEMVVPLRVQDLAVEFKQCADVQS